MRTLALVSPAESFGWHTTDIERRHHEPFELEQTSHTISAGRSLPHERNEITWRTGRYVTIDTEVGGRITRFYGGVTWKPKDGDRLYALREADDQSFYVVVSHKDIAAVLIKDGLELRIAGIRELPVSVAAKLVQYHQCEDLGGEAIIPVMNRDPLPVAAVTARPKPDKDAMDERTKRFLWFSDPNDPD